MYQLEIDLDGYLASLGTISLYPAIIIRFRILDPDCPQHISLLVTSSAYFTYQQAGMSAGPHAVAEKGPAAEGDGGGYA